MKRRLQVSALVMFAALTLLMGCDKKAEESSEASEIVVSETSDTETAAFPVTVCGTVLEKAAERAVSLSPAVTEIVRELGFGDRLIGISGYCDFPENPDIPRLGSSENPDLDGIIKLSPDAVFTLSALSERDAYVIEQAGIAVVALKVPLTVQGRTELYTDIASAFYGAETDGEVTKAEKAGGASEDALKSAAAGVELGGFVYITEKLTAAGPDTFESAVLSLSGNNLCKSEGYSEISVLGGVHPKSLVVDDALTMDDIAGSDALSALAEGADVYFVESSGFERPSARTEQVFGKLKSAATSE